VRMDNPFASAPTFTFTNLNVNPFLSEPMPLGGRTGLGTRMYHTALRTVGGVTHLLAEHSPGFNDGAGTHAKVQWYDIDVTNPSSVALLQQGKIDPGAGIDAYFPDADIAADGSIGLNFSQSVPFGSTLPRPGIMDMYVTGRRPGDPTGTMRTPLVAVLGGAPPNPLRRARAPRLTTLDPAANTLRAAHGDSAHAHPPHPAACVQASQ